MAVIGIDLGTTNSLGAVYRNNRVELIPNRFGSFLTPSVVSVAEDGTILVGEIAKQRLVTHPESTAASFKKDMGTERKWKLGNKSFLPEELSSFVIRSIIQDAKEYLGEEIEEAIISVPAYFHDKQRVATKQAGALAGITVNRIINEPSAAAMASYFDTSMEQMFLIFDFGGGTLDVSIVDCFDTMVEIISVSGDNRLGGDNFHEIMAEKFMEEHKLTRCQAAGKERAILLRQAEICKQKLTTEETAKMSAMIVDELYESTYTNQRLMEESSTVFARIKKVLIHALRDGGLNIEDIDAIVMVGGSSKMPLIQSYLQHLFKKTPISVGNCDEMIARGLGLICAVKTRDEEIKDYVLTDICPFTLGTDIYNETDPEHNYMAPIIERNTVLPCSRMKRFYTSHDNQTKIDIQILQGEHHYAEDNLVLGKMDIPVPKKKRGQEAVDIRFTYDINGILIADMTVVSTGQTVSKVLSQNMSEKEMQNKIQELEKLKIHPKDIAENQLVMEKLQLMFEEAPVYLREQLHAFITNFESILAKQNPRHIKNYRQFLERVIVQMEADDPFHEELDFPEYEEEFDGKGNKKMDELTAYQVLCIEPGSTREEIKEAYAALSKEFHPEEAPEEFQRIHEAYVTLTRNNRRNRGIPREAAETIKPKEVHHEEPFDFSSMPRQEEKLKETEEMFDQQEAYDFEQTLEHAEEQEKAKEHELTLQAVAEMRMLLSPGYREKFKLFQAFFKKDIYQGVLKKPEFVQTLANLLADTKLKPAIYDYIISYYRFRALNSEISKKQLIPEAAALYDVLEKKRGIHVKKNIGVTVGIPAGIVAGIRAGIKQGARANDQIAALVLLVVLGIAIYWIYKKLYENHSKIFALFMISAGLFVSHFFAVMTDFYAPILGGVDNGTMFASLVILVSLIMMAVFAVMAFIQKIRRK